MLQPPIFVIMFILLNMSTYKNNKACLFICNNFQGKAHTYYAFDLRQTFLKILLFLLRLFFCLIDSQSECNALCNKIKDVLLKLLNNQLLLQSGVQEHYLSLVTFLRLA